MCKLKMDKKKKEGGDTSNVRIRIAKDLYLFIKNRVIIAKQCKR